MHTIVLKCIVHYYIINVFCRSVKYTYLVYHSNDNLSEYYIFSDAWTLQTIQLLSFWLSGFHFNCLNDLNELNSHHFTFFVFTIKFIMFNNNTYLKHSHHARWFDILQLKAKHIAFIDYLIVCWKLWCHHVFPFRFFLSLFFFLVLLHCQKCAYLQNGKLYSPSQTRFQSEFRSNKFECDSIFVFWHIISFYFSKICFTSFSPFKYFVIFLKFTYFLHIAKKKERKKQKIKKKITFNVFVVI